MLCNFKVYGLAKNFYWAVKGLRISAHLKGQLLRSSSSVVLNIAEGSGKRTPAEQRRFYTIALGSLRESEAILELERNGTPETAELARQIGAILFTLSRRT
jgi:four helix bundle protein